MIDIGALKDWLGVIAVLISIGTSIVLFVGSGAKRNAEKIDKQESKLTDHDRRIQRLEGEIEHLPKRETAHNLELALVRITGRLDTMDERLTPIAATSVRLQEFLLEQAKPK